MDRTSPVVPPIWTMSPREKGRSPSRKSPLMMFEAEVWDANPIATVTAGSTWGFQLAYRDPAAGGTMVNFSPALRVTFCP